MKICDYFPRLKAAAFRKACNTVEQTYILISVIAAIALLFFIHYNFVKKIRPDILLLREKQLEIKIQELTTKISALQNTIDILSVRIGDLQNYVDLCKRENDRLRADLIRYIPIQTTSVSEIADALAKLTSDEFAMLVFDNFNEVYNGFTSSQTLNAQRLAVIEYAQKHVQLDKLRNVIESINPMAFISRIQV